jgi:hypothetical protein
MKNLLTVCLVLLTTLAVACDSKQGEGETTEPAQSTEKAQADQVPADEDKATDQKEEASQVDIPEDQTMKGMSEGKNFFVVITPEPNPIPFQEVFEMEVKVFGAEGDENTVEDVALDQVRATMPAHGHGMKTEPKITELSPGTFRVEGMKFHMQGEGEHGLWVVETVINQGDTIDQAKFDAQCCRK